ncbi:hypothetical protein ACHAWF_010157 [Thalassiosira exigua]
MFQSIPTALLAAAAIAGGGRTSLHAAAADTSARPVPADPNSVSNESRGSYNACPQVPSLRCKNGSTCEEGVGDWGRHHENLDLQRHEGGYYCKCLSGYIGHECAIQVDDCDGDSGYDPSDPTGVLQSCYHGARCRSTGGADRGFYCDCKELNMDTGPTATKFAGLMCQHESTGLCAASMTREGAAPNEQFCTNHGTCVKMVQGGEAHPGCACKEGWLGDRCEVRADVLASIQKSEAGTNAVAGKVLFGLLVGAIGCVTVLIVVVLVQARRKMMRERANVGGSGELPRKTVADVEPDGSGTLGKEGIDPPDADADAGEGEGDMELTLKEEDDAPAPSEQPEIV